MVTLSQARKIQQKIILRFHLFGCHKQGGLCKKCGRYLGQQLQENIPVDETLLAPLSERCSGRRHVLVLSDRALLYLKIPSHTLIALCVLREGMR